MTTNTFLTQSDFKRTVHHTDKLRVAAYIRVSTDSEDQENSFEVQKAYFEETLSKNNQWISAGVFADYGLSGTQKKKEKLFYLTVFPMLVEIHWLYTSIY